MKKFILKEGKPTKVVFHRGGKAIAKRNRFAWFRKQLGQAKKLWRIKATREKEARFMRDLNHKVSSAVVQLALTVDNPVIVMEDLKHIRERMRASRKLNKHLHAWSFRQLQSFIEYKANWQAIPVVCVSARYTSQRCSQCGYTEKANRKGRAFKCKKCGFGLNADLNAAVNIAKNFSSSYMLEESGDVATPLTLKAKAYQGSPHL